MTTPQFRSVGRIGLPRRGRADAGAGTSGGWRGPGQVLHRDVGAGTPEFDTKCAQCLTSCETVQKFPLQQGFVAQLHRVTWFPKPQAQLRHGVQCPCCRAAQLREAVEERNAHMQLHHWPLKRARHHALTQALEAVHLSLHQASSVLATPLLADTPSQHAGSSEPFSMAQLLCAAMPTNRYQKQWP